MLTVLTRVEGSPDGLTFIKAILQAPKTFKTIYSPITSELTLRQAMLNNIH